MPKTPRENGSSVPSLYRHRSEVNGKLRPVGSYTIDIRTKTVGRIFKSTGVFPANKHAVDLVSEIRLMIKDLDSHRDEVRLGQIKQGKVRLLDALVAHKTGRLSAAEAHGHEPLGSMLRSWLASFSVSKYTTDQYTHYVNRLERMGAISSRTVVRDAPDVLRDLRVKFNRENKAIYFRSIRTMFISFLKGGLGFDTDSVLLKAIQRVPLIPVRSRREHHPLRSVRELVELGNRINTEGRWRNRSVDYRSWIYFLVLTGMRPTEFERGVWQQDATTGHLLIKGTKTINARRIVPSIFDLPSIPRRLANLQMRLLGLIPRTPVRTRDFRRTAAVWFEEAGIPRSRYSYYLGHGASDITGLYERRTPSKSELDADRARLVAFLDTGRSAEPKTTDVVTLQSAEEFVDFLNGNVS